MRLKDNLDLLLDINEKFNNFKYGQNVDYLYFEVLHSSLSAILLDMTEDEYNSIPPHIRGSLEKLEQSILGRASDKYVANVRKFNESFGRFRRNVQVKNEPKIGFVRDEEVKEI